MDDEINWFQAVTQSEIFKKLTQKIDCSNLHPFRRKTFLKPATGVSTTTWTKDEQKRMDVVGFRNIQFWYLFLGDIYNFMLWHTFLLSYHCRSLCMNYWTRCIFYVNSFLLCDLDTNFLLTIFPSLKLRVLKILFIAVVTNKLNTYFWLPLKVTLKLY